MARLRTPAMMVSMAIKARTEGMGVRATGRVLDKSHATIIRWEQRLAAQLHKWSPVAPSGAEVTIEGDAARAPEISSSKKRMQPLAEETAATNDGRIYMPSWLKDYNEF